MDLCNCNFRQDVVLGFTYTVNGHNESFEEVSRNTSTRASAYVRDLLCWDDLTFGYDPLLRASLPLATRPTRWVPGVRLVYDSMSTDHRRGYKQCAVSAGIQRMNQAFIVQLHLHVDSTF